MSSPGFPGGPPTPTLPIGEAQRIADEVTKATRKIDDYIVAHGLPFPLITPVLTQLSFVDTAAMKRAAAAWGTGGDQTGDPPALANGVQDAIADALSTLNGRWHGPAYDAFHTTIGKTDGVIKQLTAPSQEIGQAVDSVAEAFKLGIIEIAAWGLTAISVALAIASVGFVFDAEVHEIVLAVVAFFFAIIGVIVTAVQSADRVTKRNDAIADIDSAIQKLMPNFTDADFQNPDPAGWLPS